MNNDMNNDDLISRADLWKKVISHIYPVDILENEHKVITEVLMLIGNAPGQWIPITFRKANDEEYEAIRAVYRSYFSDIPREEAKVYDCRMPDDGQEVLITTRWGAVCEDTFHADAVLSGFEYQDDPDDVIAWMPKPEAYKKEEES